MQRRKQGERATVPPGGAKWSADDARRILDEWATSGETLYAFARKRGLVPQRLWWWQKRLANQRRPVADEAAQTATATFLPVAVRAAARPEPIRATVELSDGVRIDLHSLDAASAAWLARLLKALGERS